MRTSLSQLRARRDNGQILGEHEAFRYDAFPPWTNPDTWWYRCGDDQITGARLKASPVIHVIATYDLSWLMIVGSRGVRAADLVVCSS